MGALQKGLSNVILSAYLPDRQEVKEPKANIRKILIFDYFCSIFEANYEI